MVMLLLGAEPSCMTTFPRNRMLAPAAGTAQMSKHAAPNLTLVRCRIESWYQGLAVMVASGEDSEVTSTVSDLLTTRSSIKNISACWASALLFPELAPGCVIVEAFVTDFGIFVFEMELATMLACWWLP
jgi:hypothetical protein